MDPALYKDFKTSRGVRYHYFISEPAGNKTPTLLFLHGFPSTSMDWERQVPFFVERGFGVVVPDLLGYGGTDKPRDPEMYKMSLMCQDIVNIIDHEGLHKIIAVGHDWGSTLTSRLATYHQDRFEGFAEFAVGYQPPKPDFDLDEVVALNHKSLGSDLFGYWYFFDEDDAGDIIAKHLDSFLNLLFPSDPALWINHLAPTGAWKAWTIEDRIEGSPSYLTKSELEKRKEIISRDGLHGATCWYKAMVRKFTPAEEKAIPRYEYVVNKPFLFGAALQDYVCLAEPGKKIVEQFCVNSTVVDFDTDHWIPLAAPEQVNKELLSWLKGLGLYN